MLPCDYATCVESRSRWVGWLELLEHPTGQGILPQGTTVQQRGALCGLANALISFSSLNTPASRRTEEDWSLFSRCLHRVAAEQGLTGERQWGMIIDEWVAQERQVSPLLSLSLYYTPTR